MHAERDMLVTVVFPELRERLEQLGLEFFDVDLRWGVPQIGVDGERANSWTYCRQWIDRVEPFFICLLGERYGWTPPEEEILDGNERQQYAGLSITEMEVRHAALGQLRRRSYFYFRETRVPAHVPAGIRETFVGAGEHQRLAGLKSTIRATGRPVREYRPRWAGNGFDRLEAFGEAVLEDLWSGVLRDPRYVAKDVWRAVLGHNPDHDPLYTDDSTPLPQELWQRLVERAEPAPPDPLDAEGADMRAFAAARLRWFRGRRREIQQLRAYIEATPVRDGRICVVRAEPGAGKSALLAKLTEDLEATPHLVMSHFIGATERSADVRSLLERFLGELDRQGIRSANEERKNDLESLRHRLALRIENYHGPRRLVFIIDGVNQLTDGHDLSWLPCRLGPEVRLVVSCVDRVVENGGPEARVVAALARRRPEPLWVRLAGLARRDVAEVVSKYLREYCKELDAAERRTILDMEQARNPLYLLVMLHELRTLGGEGIHLEVRDIIAELRNSHPDTVSLFDWMLQRLEVFGREAVSRWWIYLSLGRVGMSSRELSDLLGQALGDDAARAALRIERSVRRYLQRRGKQWDVFHGQLREAVVRRYGPRQAGVFHQDLARYFAMRWNAPDHHATSELPYHQVEGGLWGDVESTLCSLAFIEAKCTAGLAFGLVDDFVAALKAHPSVPSAALTQSFDFVRDNAHVLARYPEVVLQQAANGSDASAPALAAKQMLDTSGQARPWLRWVNKASASHPAITLLGHRDEVRGAAYSPDGSRVISVSADGTLRFWDAHSGAAQRTLAAGVGLERCVYRADGQRILTFAREVGTAIGEISHVLREWDPDAGEIVAERRASYWDVWSAFYVGQTLCTLSAEVPAAICDATSGRALLALPGGAHVCAASRDGNRILVGGFNGDLAVWDVRSGREVFNVEAHDGAITACAWAPDGRMVASASEERSDAAVGDQQAELGTVRIWDTSTGECLHALTGHTRQVNACAFTNDGERLASGGEDGAVVIWEVVTGVARDRLPDHGGGVTACQFAPDDTGILSASRDGAVRLWKLGEAGKAAARTARHSSHVRALVYDPGGRHVLTSSADATLRIWDVSSGDPVAELREHVAWINDCAYSPDARTIVSVSGAYRPRRSGENIGILWDADRRTVRKRLEGHTLHVDHCRFLPDGSAVVTAGLDPTIRIWDARTGGLVKELDAGKATTTTACSADGTLLLSGQHSGRTLLWDLTGDEAPFELTGHADAVWSLDIAVDGRLLATSSIDGVLQLWAWNPRRKEIRRVWQRQGCHAAHFSPSVRQLASVERADQVLLWSGQADVVPVQAEAERRAYFSSDGRFLAASSRDGVLRICRVDDGRAYATFVRPGLVFRGFGPAARLALADSSGALDVLELIGPSRQPSVVTAAYLYRTARRRFDRMPSARCPCCAARFRPPQPVTNRLRRPEESVFGGAEIPDEAWTDPGLLARCPSCDRDLRFNPFLLDARP
jgi:WD40 repeat protein